jgi:hypothetical protein
MMTSIWAVVTLFAGISLVTANSAPLVAGLILACIGILVERLYR